MHKALILGVTAAAGLSTAALASPIDGLWRTQVHNGDIQIYACGGSECGRVVDSDLLRAEPGKLDSKNSDASLQSRPIKGEVIMHGFTGGPTEWKGGTIYNPDDGHTYYGTITLTDPATLKLTGCVVFPLCQTHVWHKER